MTYMSKVSNSGEQPSDTVEVSNPAKPSADEAADCIVVGSGPAGVACARALLDRGRRVLMLDAGVTLEPERQPLIERLQVAMPHAWRAADVAAYRAGMSGNAGGIPLKLVYGSDFPYREADAHLSVDFENVGLRPSFASGGLSNVWGAAMLPYLAADIADWPISVSALEPHYVAVLELTGLSACRDDLERDFPLYTDDPYELEPSSQARRLLESLAAHRTRLASDGITFGRSRLAVRGSRQEAGMGCKSCRLCMYGCPYDYIYSAAHSLPALMRDGAFRRRTDVVVTAIRESPTGVEVRGYGRGDRRPLQWLGRRVFLGCGVIPTTAILLRSLGAYDRTVRLKDSEYFLLPLLQLRRCRGAALEPLHALCQVFLEMRRPGEQAVASHLQIYSNNDLINEAVANAFGPLGGALSRLMRDLQERLLVAQGFLPSTNSSTIAVTLRRDAASDGDRLEVKGEVNERARTAVHQVARRLVCHTRRLGAIPLLPMLKIAEPGRSFHCGGSFPMAREPRDTESDTLGRISGLSRVHAVDATVLPSIAATTITFTAMANAHRIGSLSAALDAP